MKNLEDTIVFPCGQSMKNRFMLAPMTNQQSHEDGSLSNDEYKWLSLRAKGGFGLTMTCATYVSPGGKGFSGQLGIFNDNLREGHEKLAKAIKAQDSLAVVQLYHGGMRSPEDVTGSQPLCPSDNERTGARALQAEEIETIRDDFIRAAVRARDWGYNGVEIHGAHGYLLSQFLSEKINLRDDKYGGSLENRASILFEIVHGIRQACGKGFLLGVRLSPERFGMDVTEIKNICERLIDECEIDFLDISLWDCYKKPEDPKYGEKTLLEHFTEINYKGVKLTVAGNIRTASTVQDIIDRNVDFVTIGRAAILHHDFPQRVINDPKFEPTTLPVNKDYLRKEGLGDNFITYMKNWPGFVENG